MGECEWERERERNGHFSLEPERHCSEWHRFISVSSLFLSCTTFLQPFFLSSTSNERLTFCVCCLFLVLCLSRASFFRCLRLFSGHTQTIEIRLDVKMPKWFVRLSFHSLSRFCSSPYNFFLSLSFSLFHTLSNTRSLSFAPTTKEKFSMK